MLLFQKQFLIPQRASGEGGGLEQGAVQQTKPGRTFQGKCVCVRVRAGLVIMLQPPSETQVPPSGTDSSNVSFLNGRLL